MKKVCDYHVATGGYKDFVVVGDSYYLYRESDEELPKVGAFCRNCATESATPRFPIWMNARPAYGLRCEKCKSEYPMYVDTFRVRYLGSKLRNNKGYINPTHGTKTVVEAMDRKTRQWYTQERPKEIEKEVSKRLGIPLEEYKEMKKKWEEEDKERWKKFNQEEEERRADYRNKKIEEKSNERKRLIQEGLLVYKKGIGLVRTDTGEIYKLD